MPTVQINESMGFICLLSNLEFLDIRMCTYLNDTSFTRIVSGCTKLKQVNLSGCTGISTKGFKALGNLTMLEEIDLSWCFVDDKCILENFTLFKRLGVLKLFGCSEVTQVGITKFHHIWTERNCGSLIIHT